MQVYQVISPYTSRLDNVLEVYTGIIRCTLALLGSPPPAVVVCGGRLSQSTVDVQIGFSSCLLKNRVFGWWLVWHDTWGVT